MRGKDQYSSTGEISGRITPAYAGKRFCNSRQKWNVWDHPRLCGEKYNLLPEFGCS